MATLDPTARVDPNAVNEVVDLTMDDEKVNAAINTAHRLINHLDLSGKGLGADMLESVELYLSAHYAQMYERQTKSESVGGEFSESYMGKDDFGLFATIHGQQAISLDTTGELASFAKGRKRASIRLLASEYDRTLTTPR